MRNGAYRVGPPTASCERRHACLILERFSPNQSLSSGSSPRSKAIGSPTAKRPAVKMKRTSDGPGPVIALLRFFQLRVHLGQNVVAIKLDDRSLICLAGVDIHDGCTAAE